MRNTAVQKYGERDCKTWCLRRGVVFNFSEVLCNFPTRADLVRSI